MQQAQSLVSQAMPEELAFEARLKPAVPGLVEFVLVVDVVFIDAELGIEHGVVGPAHDVFPGIVALAHRGHKQ